MKIINALVALLLLFTLGCSRVRLSARDGLKIIPVFDAGQDGYHTYRIPAIIVAPERHGAGVCEGRKKSRSDTGDIDLLLKRSTDGGKTWSAQQVLWSDGENTCGNPAPVVDQTTGIIWLLLTWNHGADKEKRDQRSKRPATPAAFL